MSYLINIGLQRAGKPDLTEDQVRTALRTLGFDVFNASIAPSQTELTMIVEVYGHFTNWFQDLMKLSIALNQDCVAVFSYASRTGMLIGPKAAEWGEFNPDYFMTIFGNKLSDTIVL
jgi:hypothetical protein